MERLDRPAETRRLGVFGIWWRKIKGEGIVNVLCIFPILFSLQFKLLEVLHCKCSEKQKQDKYWVQKQTSFTSTNLYLAGICFCLCTHEWNTPSWMSLLFDGHCCFLMSSLGISIRKSLKPLDSCFQTPYRMPKSCFRDILENCSLFIKPKNYKCFLYGWNDKQSNASLKTSQGQGSLCILVPLCAAKIVFRLRIVNGA